ncbi:hypothetical protein SAY87_026060 [Trapa incisa]|uniref:Uncharacterized protein n=1 Tax=Trapa incisa TaxID=236973 RepID=A0AAN7JKU6_9MYRT|nr:hypothetical protein SAY87_026060 [Trapa incisa]
MQTYPSFSSTILDRIYRSIDDEADALLNEPMSHQHGSKCIIDKSSRFDQELHVLEILRACQVGDEKKVEAEAESKHNGLKQDASSFTVPPLAVRPKPMRDRGVSAYRLENSIKPEKIINDRRQRVPSLLERWMTTPLLIHACGHRCIFCNSMVEAQAQAQARAHQDYDISTVIKSKQKASKVYEYLTKVKLPVSPGGRLTNFINSIFATAGKAKKQVRRPATTMLGRKATSAVCSFSRSLCLRGNTPLPTSTGQKRIVRFSPSFMSIVGEDLEPCGHNKCLIGLPNCQSILTPVATQSNCNTGRSLLRRMMEEDALVHARPYNVVATDQKPPRVENVERDYYPNQKLCRCRSSGWESHPAIGRCCVTPYDDDASSCSSSDLFELDQMEEVQAFEANWVGRNLTIANGLKKV